MRWESAISVLSIGLMLFLVGCGSDNGTGVDVGEPPNLPSLQNTEAQPDVSFFEENQPEVAGITLANTSNYYEARNFSMISSSFFILNQIYSSFLAAANSVDAVFEDGQWVWEYSTTVEGVTADFRLTAEEVSNGYNWKMFLSYNDGQGNNFEDYLALEGFISNDKSQGEWKFNSLDVDTNDEIVAIISSWLISSENEKSMSIEIYDDEGALSDTGNYEQLENEYKLELLSTGSDDNSVMWNTSDNTGSFTQGDNKKCWDQEFMNTPCT